MDIKNVSVIGAGTMGNGIAHVFAQTGFKVTLIDVNATQLEKAITEVKKEDKSIFKFRVEFFPATKTKTVISDRWICIMDHLEPF